MILLLVPIAVVVYHQLTSSGSFSAGAFLADVPVQDRRRNDLDLRVPVTPDDNFRQPSNIVAGKHQQINLGDGSSYLVEKITKNYAMPSGRKPVAGQEYLKVDFLVGDRLKEPILVFRSDFTVRDSKTDHAYGAAKIDSDEVPGELRVEVVPPKQTKHVSLVFEIPSAGSESLQLVCARNHSVHRPSSPDQTIIDTFKVNL